MAYGAKTTGSAIVGDYASQIANKTILTTGVSPTTLGAAFVTTIATASPALLILAGRNLAKAEETAEAIRAVAPQVPIRTLELDLADKQSVRKAAATVLAWDDVAGIDVLVNNAAIITDEYGTIEGIERVFAVNHLGPFLFTNLVLPKVLAVKGRVVNVASEGHRFSNVRFMDLNFEVCLFFIRFPVSLLSKKLRQGAKQLTQSQKTGRQNIQQVARLRTEQNGRHALLAVVGPQAGQPWTRGQQPAPRNHNHPAVGGYGPCLGV